MKKINYLILLIVVFIGISCEPKYEKEYSWAYPIAGDWTLTSYKGAAVDAGPFEVKIYNTSYGKDSIWIDDYPVFSTTTGALVDWNYWGLKFKAAVNMSTKTFSTVGSKNSIKDNAISIVIKEGKIIGTDSITMDVVFSDDATTTYRIAGHRTTAYDEYMHD